MFVGGFLNPQPGFKKPPISFVLEQMLAFIKICGLFVYRVLILA
jgi:hypothetical protein